MKQKKDRRGGSKPQGPYHGKSRWLSTRITPGLRERLDRAAALSERSLSQEIERRLDRSFRDRDAVVDAFGGTHNYAVMRVLGSAIGAAETIKGTTWVEDLDLFREIEAMVLKILAAYGVAVRESPSPSRADERPDLKDMMSALAGQQGEDPGDNPLVPVAKAIRGSLIEIGGKHTADTRHVERPSTTPQERRSPGRATKGKRDLDLG